MKAWLILVLAFGLAATPSATASAHQTHVRNMETGQATRLPVVGPAPDFALVSQDGARVNLADYRGRVVAVSFMFTSCPDICPMLTASLADVQDRLGSEFGKTVAFVSITVDPERDTPEVLRQYAEAFDADLHGWAFLTGDPAAVLDVVRRYGVLASKAVGGEVGHTLLTSLIDTNGKIRVQYIGTRFNPEEFLADLLGLAGEAE